MLISNSILNSNPRTLLSWKNHIFIKSGVADWNPLFFSRILFINLKRCCRHAFPFLNLLSGAPIPQVKCGAIKMSVWNIAHIILKIWCSQLEIWPEQYFKVDIFIAPHFMKKTPFFRNCRRQDWRRECNFMHIDTLF